MVVTIPHRLVPLHRRIGSLYKKWVRHLQGQYFSRYREERSLKAFIEEFRYRATLARADFDKIMGQKDMRITKQMLLDKEEEYRHMAKNMTQIYFPTQQEGVAYGRDLIIEDWVLDFWHPLEKAMYPNYFARRELRKQQYIEMWEKLHGPKKPCDEK